MKPVTVRGSLPRYIDDTPAPDLVTPIMSTGDGVSYDPNTLPPEFGHAMLKYWGFDKNYVNVNHGSYGSLPRPVFAECNKLSLLAESNPDKFHRVTYSPLMTKAREEVASLVGAEHDEIVFVPNTTHGINTILRNIEWREGDVVVKTTTTYGAVERTAQYLADRTEPPRPTVSTVPLTFPMSHADIVKAFKAKIQEIKAAHPNTVFDIVASDTSLEGKSNRIVAIIDSISSTPGLYLPWKDLVKVCKEEGVWSVIDAAHSIGQELNINLGETKPDFWVSNCHKWLYVKRGCAALYTPKRNQHVIRSPIPTSHEYPGLEYIQKTGDTEFVLQHEWTGTMDFVPYLSVTSALAFRKWLGGEEKINGYTHKLAYEGGKHLAKILGTSVIDESGEATLCMVNVLLPLPVEQPDTPVYTREVQVKIATLCRERFFKTWNTFPAVYLHGGSMWCRISVQVWTELSDFDYVGKALIEVCKEVRETILGKEEKV